jgi:hypothetical protein
LQEVIAPVTFFHIPPYHASASRNLLALSHVWPPHDMLHVENMIFRLRRLNTSEFSRVRPRDITFL